MAQDATKACYLRRNRPTTQNFVTVCERRPTVRLSDLKMDGCERLRTPKQHWANTTPTSRPPALNENPSLRIREKLGFESWDVQIISNNILLLDLYMNISICHKNGHSENWRNNLLGLWWVYWASQSIAKLKSSIEQSPTLISFPSSSPWIKHSEIAPVAKAYPPKDCFGFHAMGLHFSSANLPG